MPRPLIHIVCGSTGAGKTTYATRLAEELDGIRFSIDEWMAALFWMDSPDPIDPAWTMARIERCNRLIWQTATGVAAGGMACILDLGFSTAKQRAEVMALAADHELPVQLHYLAASREERWRRVKARNARPDGSNQLPFAVTREMFDFVEGLFEPPSDEELRAADGVVLS
jgi:predicted kinase